MFGPASVAAGREEHAPQRLERLEALPRAQRHGIELPIINEVYHILFEGKDPRVATRRLMTRETKGEV